MEKGLSQKEAQERHKQYGKNEITTKSSTTALSIFLSQFLNILIGILAIAGILSFIVGDIIDGLFIFAVLILNAIFGFIQEYKAERSLQKLREYVKPTTRVLRDGKELEVQTVSLVPEDIVILGEGDRIPADGTILTNHGVEVDEAILTGESLPVVKTANDQLFSGTLIIKGNTHMKVMAIGKDTRFGQIAQTLGDIKTDQTPLQKRLDGLAKMLSLIILVVAALLIPIGIMQNQALFPLLLLSVSIAVAAIPQGLPAVITIALAIGTSRMAKKYAIVRKMPAVETLGAVQIILTDKTGTLTQNTMRVKKDWFVGETKRPLAIKASILGNTASLLSRTDKTFDVAGDKTDGALLLWAHEQHVQIATLQQAGKVLEEFSFDPIAKSVVTIWEEGKKKYVFVRGAPEQLLANSKISKDEKAIIEKSYEAFAKEGYRVIAFGAKEITAHTLNDRAKAEKDIAFLGFVGIYDPPREEVKLAISQARAAGIKTIMVTGDNELTALAIAKEVGLIEKNEDVITGDDLAKLSDEDVKKILEKTRVFARTKPEDKLRLTNMLKKKGYVVAVTGDGVNDALALKRADVGVAMGESGTDVAKEASDIILLDDNYSTLVKAVEEGRTIYNNILKAVTYLLTGNLSELCVVFFATLLGMPLPLLPTQILWINLVTDGVPALALASDNKDPHVLKHKPRNPNAPILSNHRLLFITIAGFSLALFLLLLFKVLLGIYSETVARTIVFNVLVFSHMGIAFLVRGRGIFKANKTLILGVLFTIALQIFISFHPFFQNLLHLDLGFN